MSKNNTEYESHNDEIDLLDLFRRMGRTISKWFSAIGKAILVSIVFLIRNFFPLLISLLFGIGLSYIIKWTTKPFHISEITFKSNVVSNSEMISYINRLNKLLSEKSISQVRDTLSINPENDPGILDLEALWIIDKNYDSIPDFVDYRNRHDVYDSVNVRMKDRFTIRVKVRNPARLSNIRDGIISYVNSNPVFQKTNEIRLQQNDEMLTRINYDIKQLDSLQKVKYFEETRNKIPEKGGQMIFLQEQKTQLVYDNIYSLYREKQTIELEKSLHPDIISLVSDFYQPGNRHNGGFYYGKVIIPVVFGLMFIYLIIHRNRKRLKEIYREY
jgi:hypothetical protein